jgi:hypothetical protein
VAAGDAYAAAPAGGRDAERENDQDACRHQQFDGKFQTTKLRVELVFIALVVCNACVEDCTLGRLRRLDDISAVESSRLNVGVQFVAWWKSRA